MNTSLRTKPLPSDITNEDLGTYARVKAELIARNGEEGLGSRRSLEQIAALPDDALISRTEASRLLGTSVGTLGKWASLGRGPRYVSIGHNGWARYRMGDIRSFLADHLVDTSNGGQS